jgi:hypothetical protein
VAITGVIREETWRKSCISAEFLITHITWLLGIESETRR